LNAKLNCGVIGLGRLGYRHALSIVKNKDANLVAVADPMDEALLRAKEDFGSIVTSNDYTDILERKDIEAVVIATPTKTHYDILVNAISAGKKIFVEKPITFTVDEAKKICNLVKEKNTYLQVGFMRRFDPGHVEAKKLIESGEIGEPIYVHDCQRDPCGPPKHYVPESGGLFVDMGIHDLDCVRWLMGSEIVRIYAQGAVLKHNYLKDMNDVDQGQMLLTFANGTLGDIEVSRNANDIYDVRTEIIGTKGSVFIGQCQNKPFITVGSDGMTYNLPHWCLDRFEQAYEKEIAAFIDSVRNEKESPVNAYDGMVALNLAKSARDSFEKSKAIDIQL